MYIGSIRYIYIILYVYYAHAHYKPTAAVAYDDDVAAGVVAAKCSFSRRVLFFFYILSFILHLLLYVFRRGKLRKNRCSGVQLLAPYRLRAAPAPVKKLPPVLLLLLLLL